MYCIVDIETTGGGSSFHRITEIAIIKHDGVNIVDEFTTLLNPERNIPWNITRLTGITNEMVSDAPKFYEVAKRIVEITENCVFVAHNVSFDYNFIKNEFKQLGFEFKRHNLCTVKMSRALIPGKKSYSLGNLCNSLGIEVKERHRASGDAFATAKLFELLFSINKNYIESRIGNSNYAFSGLNASLDRKKIDSLPEETGVYYLYDIHGRIIYIGKSTNIRQRVLQHLEGKGSSKSSWMRRSIADISYELTGSELIALLLEADEIKKLQPFFNRSLKRKRFNYGICLEKNREGYLCISAEPIEQIGQDVIITFASMKEAKTVLNYMLDRYRLCQRFTGLYDTDGACFNHQVHECFGACIGKELPDSYNKRVNEALRYFRNETKKNVVIVDDGRTSGEKSVVCLEEGNYKGFGYIDESFSANGWDDIRESIKPFQNNRDTEQIIRQYLLKNKVKVLEF